MKEKKVEVQKVYTRKKNGIVPILVKFQNGKLSAFTKENTLFTTIKDENNKTNALFIANEQCYQGQINDSEANDLVDNYLVVRNKTTNKMVLIPIDQVCLKNCVYAEIDKSQKKQLTQEISKKTLHNKFGGRKASRFINDQEQMKMNIEIVQEELETTLNESSFQENYEDVVDNSAYLNGIRPPYNPDATAPNEVYKIEDVIPSELLDRLEEEAKTVFQTQPDQLPIASAHFKELLGNIQKSPASAESIMKIKIIIYLDCLQKLITSRAKSFKKIELSKISEKVENNIKERFSDSRTTKGIGSRTTFSTEKALCHFIVLCLLLDNKYQTDINVLSQELNAPRIKISKYAHVVFATPKSKTSLLTLKIPSKVPALKQNSRHRRD